MEVCVPGSGHEEARRDLLFGRCQALGTLPTMQVSFQRLCGPVVRVFERTSDEAVSALWWVSLRPARMERSDVLGRAAGCVSTARIRAPLCLLHLGSVRRESNSGNGRCCMVR
jgi:hypothetical protein